MSKDWTFELIELENAKAVMQEAVRAIRRDEERKAKAAAREAIKDRVEEVEHAFAQRLAAANAAGIPQALLRSEVLRTNDWNTWVKWRDKAEITPQRIVMTNAKEERARANAPFQWSDDYSSLRVTKNTKGVEIVPPLEFIIPDEETLLSEVFYPTHTDWDAYVAAAQADTKLRPALAAEVKARYDEGLLYDSKEF
jgi:hypothetical protein